MKTYLVTGGAGFIGSNFVHYVLEAQDDVRIVNVDKLTYAGNLENIADLAQHPRHVFEQVDICDAVALDRLFTKFEPDVVVNFAAESHVDRSIHDCSSFVRTNIEGTATLLQVAKDDWEQPDGSFGEHLFLQVSTDEVYGSLSLENADEAFTESTPLDPHSPYSASKASADMLVKSFYDTYKFPAVITRCSNNYGPFQFPEKLIPLCIKNCLEHEKIPVYGDGLNVRDWLFVKDHCAAIDCVLRNGVAGNVYNIGGCNEHSNIEIVKTIIACVSGAIEDEEINDSLIEYVQDRKGHDRRYAICAEKIADNLGWEPQASWQDGIADTIIWYLQHSGWLSRVESGEYRKFDAGVFNKDFPREDCLDESDEYKSGKDK